jgi:hypothetical protein
MTPAMRTSQLVNAIQRVGRYAPEWNVQILKAAIAVAQCGPVVTPDGNGREWPMWKSAARTPE